MSSRDRVTGLVLLALAIAAWVAVGWLLVSRSPVGQPVIQLAGAVAIGTAIAITGWPLLWLVGLVRGRARGEGGDWTTAGRRAAIAGVTVGVLVMLRGQGALSTPLAIFVVTLGILVEAAFTLRR